METISRLGLTAAIAAVMAAGWAAPARAQSLIGQSVTGTLTIGSSRLGATGVGPNLFDPSEGFVPFDSSYLNALEESSTVTISSPEIEFGADYFSNLFEADFDANSLVFRLTTVEGSIGPTTATFQSAGFLGRSLEESSDSFVNGGVLVNLVNDTLTVSWAGLDQFSLNQFGGKAVNAASITFTNGAAVVPEPGEWAVMGMAALSVGGLMLRARRK